MVEQSSEAVVREVLLNEVAEEPHINEQVNKVAEEDSRTSITTTEVAEAAEVDASAGETMINLSATVMPQSIFALTGP